MGEKCYVLVHENHTGDSDVSVYREREDAVDEMTRDSQEVRKFLEEQGHEPGSIVVLEDFYGNTEVYVRDTGISYGWTIKESAIK
ncbi:MAG: hypothetical protein LUE14_04055 [Clostridiales bacterium]|nr:hypothetical protein [Clostridiales bacterium]